MSDIGDVCLVQIFFNMKNKTYKIRPVLILNKINTTVTIAKITSVPSDAPPTYYDQFKEKIIDWKQCGLDKQSYVKCKNIHNITNIRLLKKLGSMSNNDLLNIVAKIEEYN